MANICTRSFTETSLFGQSAKLPLNKLPTCEDVVRAYYWNQKSTMEKRNVQEQAKVLATVVKDLYTRASIPSVSINSIIIRIKRLMKKVHDLEKYSDLKRSSLTFQGKLNNFKNVFDVCTCKCFDAGIRNRSGCTCSLPLKIPQIEWNFWIDQKTVRSMIIGKLDREATLILHKRENRKYIESKSAEALSLEIESEIVQDNDDDDDNVNILDEEYASSENEISSEGKYESVQNRNKYQELCKAVDRCKMSNRDACLIVNAVLKDLNMLSSSTILAPSKLRYQRNMWRSKLVQEHAIENKELYCIGFDGKQDITLGESSGCRRTLKEEHYAIISFPGNKYIDHVVPESSKSVDITREIMSVIIETNSVESLQGVVCDGTNLNTGKTNGIIRKLEENLGRPLQWLICLLHCNELPFRRFLTNIECATSTGPSTSTGVISSSLQYDPKDLPIINFTPISGKVKDVDDIVQKDLSTDQLYFLRACLAVQSGRQASSYIKFLEKSAPGNLSHARWLTKANRILRLYMSTVVASKPLRRATHFILNFYGPAWFHIKSHSSCQNGAKNFFFLIQLYQKLDAEDQTIIRPALQNNCYFAHPENILLAAVSDNDKGIRKRAVDYIITAREKQATNTIRIFEKNISINFAATSYVDMIDWNQSNVTSPPMLSHLSNDQLNCNQPVLVQQTPCHSQAVERTVKDVTAASRKVYGKRSRHGMVLQGKKSRLDLPKIDSKIDFH